MSKEIKEFFEGVELREGEEFNHDSMIELSNNRENEGEEDSK